MGHPSSIIIMPIYTLRLVTKQNVETRMITGKIVYLAKYEIMYTFILDLLLDLFRYYYYYYYYLLLDLDLF